MHVVALYTSDVGSVYDCMPMVDVYGESRDARTYEGRLPVVAHPPCESYSLLRLLRKRSRFSNILRIGLDDGCFSHAISKVRINGGVLEHPLSSMARYIYSIPMPRYGEWSNVDKYGGRSIAVDQGCYGHKCAKPTLLYAAKVSFLEVSGERLIGMPESIEHITGCNMEKSRVRSITPPAFAELLVRIARTVHYVA